MRFFLILGILFSFSLSQAQANLEFSKQLLTKKSNLFVQEEDQTLSEQESGSNMKYILYSLLLPGAGQWSMGHKGRAKFFLGTEFLLWVGYFGSNAYANNTRNDYHSLAALHANVNTKSKSEQYWIDIGSSSNIFDFNKQQLRERNLNGIYSESSQNFWQWDSQEAVEEYNSLRIKEHNWEQRATFMVGAFVLNRLVSAVDVIRLVKKESKTNQQNKLSQLYFDYKTSRAGAGLVRLNFRMNW
jgi:hypothetical protein